MVKRSGPRQDPWGTPQVKSLWHFLIKGNARSVNLEMYCRLLMGRKFLKSESRPGNLSKGVTSPSFQSQGKCPILMEPLIKHVITGRSSSNHDTTSEVGTGSLGQDFLLHFWISSETWPSSRDSQSCLLGPTTGSSGSRAPTLGSNAASILDRMVFNTWSDGIH